MATEYYLEGMYTLNEIREIVSLIQFKEEERRLTLLEEKYNKIDTRSKRLKIPILPKVPTAGEEGGRRALARSVSPKNIQLNIENGGKNKN